MSLSRDEIRRTERNEYLACPLSWRRRELAWLRFSCIRPLPRTPQLHALEADAHRFHHQALPLASEWVHPVGGTRKRRSRKRNGAFLFHLIPARPRCALILPSLLKAKGRKTLPLVAS